MSRQLDAEHLGDDLGKHGVRSPTNVGGPDEQVE